MSDAERSGVDPWGRGLGDQDHLLFFGTPNFIKREKTAKRVRESTAL